MIPAGDPCPTEEDNPPTHCQSDLGENDPNPKSGDELDPEQDSPAKHPRKGILRAISGRQHTPNSVSSPPLAISDASDQKTHKPQNTIGKKFPPKALHVMAEALKHETGRFIATQIGPCPYPWGAPTLHHSEKNPQTAVRGRGSQKSWPHCNYWKFCY